MNREHETKAFTMLGILATVAGFIVICGISREIGPSYAGIPAWITRPAVK